MVGGGEWGGEDHTQTMLDNVMLEPIYLFNTGMECVRGGGISRVVGGGGGIYIIIIFIGRLGPVWSPRPKEAVIVISEARL